MLLGSEGNNFTLHTTYSPKILGKIFKSKMLTNVVLQYYNISNHITNILKTIFFKQGNIFILMGPPFF